MLQIFFRCLAKLVGFGSQAKHLTIDATDPGIIPECSDVHSEDAYTQPNLSPEHQINMCQAQERRPTDQCSLVCNIRAKSPIGVANFDAELAQRRGKMEYFKRSNVMRRQWALVTDILDRCFALLFGIVNILALVVLFPRPNAQYWETGQ